MSTLASNAPWPKHNTFRPLSAKELTNRLDQRDHFGLEITPFYDLVNIAMYPDFEQDLAMALGDEFNSQTINAYQLADFAESCGLPRILVATRTRRLASALLKALNTLTPPEPSSESETRYLTRYYTLVNERARHLLAQAGEMRSISL